MGGLARTVPTHRPRAHPRWVCASRSGVGGGCACTGWGQRAEQARAHPPCSSSCQLPARRGILEHWLEGFPWARQRGAACDRALKGCSGQRCRPLGEGARRGGGISCRVGCRGSQPPSGGDELRCSLFLATRTRRVGLSDSLAAADPEGGATRLPSAMSRVLMTVHSQNNSV